MSDSLGLTVVHSLNASKSHTVRDTNVRQHMDTLKY